MKADMSVILTGHWQVYTDLTILAFDSQETAAVPVLDAHNNNMLLEYFLSLPAT